MGGLQVVHTRAEPDRPGAGFVRRLGPADAAGRVFILNGQARAWSGSAPGGDFSLKWAPRGQVTYGSEGARHRLRAGGVLLMNPGQPYETSFVDPAGSETFCLFFSADLLRQAWAAAGDPERPQSPAEFPNLVFQPPVGLARALPRLRQGLASADGWPSDLEAELFLALADAAAAARTHRDRAARLPAVKASTRRHLLRLEFARGLIEEEEAALDLDALALASGVSKFHLLRLFRSVMGTTPMKYAQGVRLARAAARLRASAAPVDEIAFAAGYDGAGAFGRAFRRHFGLAPSAWRAANRN